MNYIKVIGRHDPEVYAIIKIINQKPCYGNVFNAQVLYEQGTDMTFKEGQIDMDKCLKVCDVEIINNKAIQVLYDVPSEQSNKAAEDAVEVIGEILKKVSY